MPNARVGPTSQPNLQTEQYPTSPHSADGMKSRYSSVTLKDLKQETANRLAAKQHPKGILCESEICYRHRTNVSANPNHLYYDDESSSHEPIQSKKMNRYFQCSKNDLNSEKGLRDNSLTQPIEYEIRNSNKKLGNQNQTVELDKRVEPRRKKYGNYINCHASSPRCDSIPTKGKRQTHYSPQSKLPHGLTVLELKEMTRARLAAEALAAKKIEHQIIKKNNLVKNVTTFHSHDENQLRKGKLRPSHYVKGERVVNNYSSKHNIIKSKQDAVNPVSVKPSIFQGNLCQSPQHNHQGNYTLVNNKSSNNQISSHLNQQRNRKALKNNGINNHMNPQHNHNNNECSNEMSPQHDQQGSYKPGNNNGSNNQMSPRHKQRWSKTEKILHRKHEGNYSYGNNNSTDNLMVNSNNYLRQVDVTDSSSSNSFNSELGSEYTSSETSGINAPNVFCLSAKDKFQPHQFDHATYCPDKVNTANDDAESNPTLAFTNRPRSATSPGPVSFSLFGFSDLIEDQPLVTEPGMALSPRNFDTSNLFSLEKEKFSSAGSRLSSPTSPSNDIIRPEKQEVGSYQLFGERLSKPNMSAGLHLSKSFGALEKNNILPLKYRNGEFNNACESSGADDLSNSVAESVLASKIHLSGNNISNIASVKGSCWENSHGLSTVFRNAAIDNNPSLKNTSDLSNLKENSHSKTTLGTNNANFVTGILGANTWSGMGINDEYNTGDDGSVPMNLLVNDLNDILKIPNIFRDDNQGSNFNLEKEILETTNIDTIQYTNQNPSISNGCTNLLLDRPMGGGGKPMGGRDLPVMGGRIDKGKILIDMVDDGLNDSNEVNVPSISPACLNSSSKKKHISRSRKLMT